MWGVFHHPASQPFIGTLEPPLDGQRGNSPCPHGEVTTRMETYSIMASCDEHSQGNP